MGKIPSEYNVINAVGILGIAFMVRKLDPFFSFRSEAKEGDRIMSFICSGSTRVTMG